jgi:hypothetical protein
MRSSSGGGKGEGGGQSARSSSGSSAFRSSGGGEASNRGSSSMSRSSQLRSSDRGDDNRGGENRSLSTRSSDSRSGQQQQSYFRGPTSDSNRSDRDSVRTARDFDRSDLNRSDVNRNELNRSSDRGTRDARESAANRDLNNFLNGRDNDRDRGDRGDRSDLSRSDRNRLDSDRNRLDNDRNRSDVDRNRISGDRNRVDGDRNRLNGDRNRLDGDRSRLAGNRDGDRNDWSRRVRDDWGRRDRDNLPFRYGWWNSYALNSWPIYSPWRYSRWQNRPYYWWGWTPATALTSWVVYGWDRPRYWVYGNGGNIWYQDDYVYYDGNRYLPADDYYQRVYDLAHSVPAINQADAENMDWKPLGVFAVIPEGRADSESSRTFQLAINRDGVIAGTYVDERNDEVHPVSGMVDRNSQRAAWVFADGKNPKTVFETSLFNLTKPEAQVMVHYGPHPDDAEVWNLIRLERPEASQVSINQ